MGSGFPSQALQKGAKHEYKPEMPGVWGCVRLDARSRWLCCGEGGFRGADRGSRAPKCKCFDQT